LRGVILQRRYLSQEPKRDNRARACLSPRFRTYFTNENSDHDENREGLDISATCHDFAVSGSSFTANCTNELGALIANDINTGMQSACLFMPWRIYADGFDIKVPSSSTTTDLSCAIRPRCVVLLSGMQEC
jgi:hypothetical protein